MNRKKKVPENVRFKVFAFMTDPHHFIMVSQDGKKLAKIEVENEAVAKEKLTNEELNQSVIEKLGMADFSTVWVEDPASNQEVMEACAKMEQGSADELLADAMAETTGNPETKGEESETKDPNSETKDADSETKTEEPQAAENQAETQPENSTDDSLTIRAIVDKCKCEAKVNGEWKAIAFTCLSVGDVFRLFDETGSPVLGKADTFEVIEKPAPDSDAENEVNYHIIARIVPKNAPEETSEGQPAAEPKFKPAPKVKTIEVECPATPSEQKKDELIRRLQTLKYEAQAVASQYRDDIKAVEKQLFALVNGKSFTHMECYLEEDWDAGVRKYIRPDTGEVAKTEEIPYEERQLNLNKELKEATPEIASEQAEQTIEETALTAEAVAESTETEKKETVCVQGFVFGDENCVKASCFPGVGNSCGFADAETCENLPKSEENLAKTGEKLAESSENLPEVTETEEKEKCSFGIVFDSDECKKNGCSEGLFDRCRMEFEEVNEDFPPPPDEDKTAEDMEEESKEAF